MSSVAGGPMAARWRDKDVRWVAGGGASHEIETAGIMRLCKSQERLRVCLMNQHGSRAARPINLGDFGNH